MKKNIILLLFSLILSSCGVSGLALETRGFIIINNSIFSKKNKCEYDSLFFQCEKIYYINNDIIKKNDLIKENDYNISLLIYNNYKFKALFGGVFPIILPPPFLPMFFFPAEGHKDFSGGKNFKIVLIIDNNNSVKSSIDLKNVYLLKNNKKFYAINYYIDNNFYEIYDKNKIIYIIEFPVNYKKINNSLLFIDGFKIGNEKIKFPVAKIIYDSSISFAIGYMSNN